MRDFRFIIFTDAPDRLIARLAEERPRFFGDIDPADRERLRTSSAPVRWTAFSDLRGPEGEIPMSYYITYRDGGMERPVPATRVVWPSRLAAGSRMDVRSMLVIVNASDVQGISNRSLSAYLAMVVLGNLRPDHGPVGQVSILDIFSARSSGELVNMDLSGWDLAYLHSLYQGSWEVSSDQRIQRIQASMARNLEGADQDTSSRQE